MRLSHYSLIALGAGMLALSACSDSDDWGKVDGAMPVTALEASHLRTEAGYAINIKGSITDADGISKVELWCPDLFMKKTINIIGIYGKPLKEYALDYSFTINRHNPADEYDVEVRVTDVAGNTDVQHVKVTLDGDFTAPFFAAAPAAEASVVLEEGKDAVYEVEFTVTDNVGIDYVVVSVNAYDPATQAVGESVDPSHFPMTLEAYGEDTFEFSEGVTLPARAGTYMVQIEAYDMPAQNDEVRKATVSSLLTVMAGVDFPKMYLCDVPAAELTTDVFGVPMRVDKVGECQYRARYFNAEANTEVYFIPQKNALAPICFGLDPKGSGKLVNSTSALPLVLPEAGKYYEINFNTESGEYDFHTYTVEPYMNPIFWEYGSNSLNTWANYDSDSGDQYLPGADSWLQEFYIGTCDNPSSVTRFVQDKNNPNIYSWENPQQLAAGTDMHFIIHNWHHDGWWNFVAWRVDDSAECDIFYYYGGVVKEAYLKWAFGDDTDWSKWKDSEDYRKQIIYGGGGDVWPGPHVSTSGSYQMYFDAHLGRAKLVPAK